MIKVRKFAFSHISSVQLLSRVQLFATPWTATRHGSLSITNSPSLLKLIPTESVMPSNHECINKQYIGLFCIFKHQFSSVAQLCPTLCDPMNRSTPGLPVHHQLLEFTQTHVHRVSDAIQPSHPLLSPSPPASTPPSIRVFSNESTLLMRWPKYWSFSSQHTSTIF